MYPLEVSSPFYARPPDFCHTLANDFAQFGWSADVGLFTPSVAAKFPFYAGREVISPTGGSRWKYCGRYRDGRESEGLPQTKISSSFNRLKRSMFAMHSNCIQAPCVTGTTDLLTQTIKHSFPRRRSSAVLDRYHCRRKRTRRQNLLRQGV